VGQVLGVHVVEGTEELFEVKAADWFGEGASGSSHVIVEFSVIDQFEDTVSYRNLRSIAFDPHTLWLEVNYRCDIRVLNRHHSGCLDAGRLYEIWSRIL